MNKKHFYAAVILFSFLSAGIQPTFATTWIIGPDQELPEIPPVTIGTWTEGTRTFALAGNTPLGDNIQIIDNGLILDGAGYTVSGVASDPGVDLSGRTDVTIKNLNVTGCGHGIYLSLSNDCTVTDNTVSTCGHGIYLSLSNDCTVTYNTASTCDYGIWLTNSSGNILTGNTAWYNNDHGIGLSPLSDGNTLTENTASYNDSYGIYLNLSSHNILSHNTAESNNSRGIYLKESSNYNTIFNNNFIGNTTQAKVSTELHAPCTDNVFNLPAPTGGNHWSNWSGPGAYTFTGGQDNLPWTLRDGWINTPTGSNVTVSFPESGVYLTFETVTTAGTTICIVTETAPDPPAGFELLGQYYEITTTAEYVGDITVSIEYDDTGLTLEEEEELELMHWDETAEIWEDVTDDGYPDTENNIIQGTVSEFSLFAIMYPKAGLAITLNIEKAKVCWHHSDIHVEGKLYLPQGVWMNNLNPVGSAVIKLAGFEVANQSVEFEIAGKKDDKWEYKDKENSVGNLKEFKIDWKGAKFDYKGDEGLHIHAPFIGGTETTLCIHTGDVSGAFTVSIDGTTIDYDEERNITTDVEYESQKEDNTHVRFTLPFELEPTSAMTIGISEAIEPINVADYYEEGFVKFKLVSAFDSWLLPDGTDSSPDELEIEISLGDPNDIIVFGSDLIGVEKIWTNKDDKHWEYK